MPVGGYSKCQRAGILPSARWHLEARLRYNEVSTQNMVPAIDQSDCEIPLCYTE